VAPDDEEEAKVMLEQAEWHVAEGIQIPLQIPLLGTAAAGQPLEVLAVQESIDAPSLWKGRKVFALKVRGNSMVEAGIHDGDYLIVEPCQTAENGRTVVAEVDGCVTVKKLFRDAQGQIRLQPANSEMLPLVVRGDRVRIRGVVVGILRKYGFRHDPKRRTAKMSPSCSAHRASVREEPTLDLALNAIDTHLARWRRAMEVARDPQLRPGMGQMGRDLQALRDWCARTTKPKLRLALLKEANQLMQRMERFVSLRTLELPDVAVH
jgi:repressor LexA